MKKVRGEQADGENRVNRGGSWNNSARNCEASNRNGNSPSNRNNNIGFRLCASGSAGSAGASVGPRRGPDPGQPGRKTGGKVHAGRPGGCRLNAWAIRRTIGKGEMKTMNQCPSCGEAVSETARFCSACGAALAEQTASAHRVGRRARCKYCGSEIAIGVNPCPHCGLELKWVRRTIQTPTDAGSRSSAPETARQAETVDLALELDHLAWWGTNNVVAKACDWVFPFLGSLVGFVLFVLNPLWLVSSAIFAVAGVGKLRRGDEDGAERDTEFQESADRRAAAGH